MIKKYFIVVSILLASPFISLANYESTVALLGKVRSIESSAGALANLPALRQVLDSIYRDILDTLREDLAALTVPQTTSISFDAINVPLMKGTLQTITFVRKPLNTSSPVNFSIETGSGHLIGSLSNKVTSNSIQWQIADNFIVDKNYKFVARDRDDNLLGQSAVFTVSSSTPIVAAPSPTVTTPAPVTEVIPAADIASADVNRGSIGFWSFDKYSNNCNTKGNATMNDVGKVGSALTFDGAGDYCIVPSDKVFYPKYFTWAFWAKSAPDYSTGWNNSNWFISERDQSGFVIGPVKDSKDVKFMILDDASLTQVPHVVGTVTPDNITEWHHYAMTYDGTTAKVYLDGVLVTATTTTINRSYSGTKDLNFGLDDVVGQPYGAGSLDEIRLYNRPLTTCEIQILAGKGCGGMSASLYGYQSLAALKAVMDAALEKFRALIR